MKLFNKIKNGFWEILEKPHDTSSLHPGYEVKSKDIPSPPPGYKEMESKAIPDVKQQFDGFHLPPATREAVPMFITSLSPEFQKLYDKIKEKANHDPLINAAFTRMKINGHNDFETIVFIANCFIEMYSNLQKDYKKYVQNSTQPTITVNPRYKKPKEINK